MHDLYTNEPHREKTCLMLMHSIKVQISLHNYSCYMQTVKTIASFCNWAGQFDSYLVALPKTGFLMTWPKWKVPWNLLLDHVEAENLNWIGLIRKMPTFKPLHLALWNSWHFVTATKSWKFELDILNSSGDIAIQKYIEHKMKCWECTQRGTNEQFSNTLSYWVTLLNHA